MEPIALQRWSFTRVEQLHELWPGGVFRALGTEPFRADVVRRTLTSVVIEGITATPYAVQRGAKEIADQPRDDLLLHVVLQGEGVVERGGTRLAVAAGSLFLLRIGSPYAYRCPVRSRTFRATVAEDLLPARLRGGYDPPLAALAPSAVGRAFRLLAQDLLSVESDLALEGASAAHLDAALVALEQGVVAEELAARPIAADGSAVLRSAVLQHIEQRLSDPDLTPRALADRFSISVRTLHKLFEPLPETAAERIRRRRVEEAAAVLRVRNASTGELAAGLGFASRDTFQRAFRQLQGLTPAEYRALRTSLVD